MDSNNLATATCKNSSDDPAFPSICIPFSKTHYGQNNEYEITERFVKECFKRYGNVSRVILKRHTVDIDYLTTTSTKLSRPLNSGLYSSRYTYSTAPNTYPITETYYSIAVHFHSWDLENKEAKYVRSVLMLPDEYSNLKLVYYGPWYWKFFAYKQRYIKQ